MTESPSLRGKRILEQREAERQKIAKKFDPKELIRKADEIRTVEDPELGEIRYTVLSTADLFELNKLESQDARAKTMLFRLLHKAYPELTLADIDRFPMTTTTRLLTILTGLPDFLPAELKLQTGSESTQKPNKLAS